MAFARTVLVLLGIAAAALSSRTDAQTRARSARESEAQGQAAPAQDAALGAARKLADDFVAGRSVPNDFPLIWMRDDLLKAEAAQQYVPFTIGIDAARAADIADAVVYWRVVKAAPATSTSYEYVNTAIAADLHSGRISRSFTVPAGTYDVYVVLREAPSVPKAAATGSKAAPRPAPAARASVVKHTVVVPDLWNEELNTSSVIIAEKIEPLDGPLTAQQKIDRPYVLRNIEFVPFTRATFSRTDELSAFLLIYNAQVDAASKKPNVNVEFNFYARRGGGEMYFNRTLPTNLNAETLPPEFDLDAGSQLQAGQAVPLATFPAGDYRLEIKVTDKIARKTLTRAVNFTVSGS